MQRAHVWTEDTWKYSGGGYIHLIFTAASCHSQQNSPVPFRPSHSFILAVGKQMGKWEGWSMSKAAKNPEQTYQTVPYGIKKCEGIVLVILLVQAFEEIGGAHVILGWCGEKVLTYLGNTCVLSKFRHLGECMDIHLASDSLSLSGSPALHLSVHPPVIFLLHTIPLHLGFECL